MGFSEGRFELNQPKGVYYPGDIISGKVIFDESKPKKCRGIHLSIKGYCKVYWETYRHRAPNDVYESYEEFLHRKVCLIGGNAGNTTLAAGHYEFPFEFVLPTHLPSSYENEFGHIRYGLKVVMDRAYKFNQNIVMPLNILSIIDLNLIPSAKNILEFPIEDSYCCWCMLTGSSEILVKIPTTGFCVGQTISVEVSCTNNSPVIIKRIKMSIVKKTKFIATSDSGEKLTNETLVKVERGPVPARGANSWTLQMQLPVMHLYNLNMCKYINMEYLFKVVVKVGGCHTNTDQSRKIFIGNIPLRGIQ